MHIAWVIYGALEQTTGGYLYDREIVLGLRLIGHHVQVCSLPSPGSASANREALDALVAAARSADVVVGDELCFRELGPAFEALAGGPTRVLLVHHLARWEGCDDTLRAAEERALAATDVCVITSPTSAQRLTDEGCTAPVHVVEPGADRLTRFAFTRAPDAPNGPLLFVGNLLPRKQLPALLAAFERGAAAHARLVIAGDHRRDPAHAAALRAVQKASARLAASVDLRGPLSDRALAEALTQASALVLPSSLEGYGMVLTEAVAAGTPVICTDTCPAAIALATAGAALVVKAGDDAALTQTLATFTSDPTLRVRMAAAAAALSPHLPRWADATAAFDRALALC